MILSLYDSKDALKMDTKLGGEVDVGAVDMMDHGEGPVLAS